MKNGWMYIIAFLVFWVILAERVTLASTIAGMIITGFIYLYVSESYEGVNLWKSMKQLPLWILFLLQLVGAIIIANFQVAAIVLSKNMPIQPELVEYKTDIKSELLQTILANAITLTPGTMSVDIEGSTMLIHCLNHDYASSLEGNAFEKTLMRIQEGMNDK